MLSLTESLSFPDISNGSAKGLTSRKGTDIMQVLTVTVWAIAEKTDILIVWRRFRMG